jgi:predicted enzyme related to lactoylglutathione lyase
MRQGTIVFVEIPVRDLARAADFYAGLFGWSFFDEHEPNRWLFTPGGRGAMGAITTARPAGTGGVVISVSVDDVSATVDRAIALGGGPTGDVREGAAGRRTEIVDPDGNHFHVFSSALSRTQAGFEPAPENQEL